MIALLGSLLGGRGGRMIGSMIGGRTGGMVGGLAGALLGGRQLRGLGRMISNRGGKSDHHDDGPAIDLDESQAEVLIRAMCNSAKADGHVDADETSQIISELGDVSDADRAFLQSELESSFKSAADIARLVPPALKVEAYAVSLIAINVDTMEEAQYLSDLSTELGLSPADRNNIHDDLGVDQLS